MSARELVVLGTSSQVPTRYRNHNGHLLLFDGVGFLFDPGEGTQRQMIRAGVSVSQVHHICITHFHGDHSLGFAGLVQRISLDRVPHTVHVYYPASGQVYFDRLRRSTIFHDVAKIEPHPIAEPGVLWQEGALRLETQLLDHSVEAWGYRIVEADAVSMLPEALAERGLRGPDVGRLQRQGEIELEGRRILLAEVSRPRPGQKFAFVMDTRVCEGAAVLAADTDLLVIEATYTDEHAAEAHHNGHMTARQSAELARTAGVRRLVLTHLSQRYLDESAHLAEGIAAFGEDVHVPRDGQRVPFPSRRPE